MVKKIMPRVDFDTFVNGAFPGGGNGSWNHTISAGALPSGILLAVFSVGASLTSVTSATCGGDAFSKLGGASNGTKGVEIWGLANAQAGVNAISVVWGGGATAPFAYTASYKYLGGFGAIATNSGSGGSPASGSLTARRKNSAYFFGIKVDDSVEFPTFSWDTGLAQIASGHVIFNGNWTLIGHHVPGDSQVNDTNTGQLSWSPSNVADTWSWVGVELLSPTKQPQSIYKG